MKPVSFSQLHPETVKYLMKVMTGHAGFAGGLDPQVYPEKEAPCGCKFIDGTCTDMCETHEIDMHSVK